MDSGAYSTRVQTPQQLPPNLSVNASTFIQIFNIQTGFSREKENKNHSDFVPSISQVTFAHIFCNVPKAKRALILKTTKLQQTVWEQVTGCRKGTCTFFKSNLYQIFRADLFSLMLAVSYSVSSSVHATGLSEPKRMQNTMKYVSACQKHSLNSYSDINTTSTAAVPFSSRYERTADVNCTSVLST